MVCTLCRNSRIPQETKETGGSTSECAHTDLVEAEVALEDGVAEPDLAEGVQQALIVVVSDATAILDLPEHVPDARPHHSLRVQTFLLRSKILTSDWSRHTSHVPPRDPCSPPQEYKFIVQQAYQGTWDLFPCPEQNMSSTVRLNTCNVHSSWISLCG